MLSGNKYTSQRYLSVSSTDTCTKRRLFICFSRLGKKVTKMYLRFVIKIGSIKRSTKVI